MVLKVNVRIAAVLCAAALLCVSFGIVKAATAQERRRGEGVSLPVLMYHHVLKSSGSLGKYTVSPQELENDIRYMQDKGYEAVFVNEVIDYVYSGAPLPEKPMLITFDDGYETMLAYVLPVLRKLNAKAVISVVGAYTDFYSKSDLNKSLSYSNLNWDEVGALAESGLVEIQNHSYDMHEQKGARHGCKMAAGETTEQYVKAMQDDILLNQEKIKKATGEYPACFTYPYGYYNNTSEKTIKLLGFKASLSCAEGVSFIEKGKPQTLFTIKRYNRPHGASTAFLDKIIKKAEG